MKRLLYALLLIGLLYLPSTIVTESGVSAGPMDINEIEKLIDEKLDQTVKHDNIDSILTEKNVLTDKEVMQQLIDLQTDRIGLLQGNISSVLTIIGILVAFLAFLGFVFSYWLKKQLAAKLDDAERIHNEIKSEKGEVTRAMNEASALKKDLRASVNDVNEHNRQLIKNKLLYEESRKDVERLRMYIKFQDVKIERLSELGRFTWLREDANRVVKELHNQKKIKRYSEPNLLYKVHKYTGGIYKEDESILEKVDYYIKELEDEEKNVLEAAERELTFFDYEDDVDGDGDFHDDCLSALRDWEGYYDRLKQILLIIEAYIAMNEST